MSLDMIDLVWSLMRDGEFYSPADLANTLGQPTDTIVRILEFLARYKFAERMTKRELIFRKIPTGPSPNEAVKILRMLRANAALNRARQVANISKTSRRLNLT
jgi:predicted transcriptional regulator